MNGLVRARGPRVIVVGDLCLEWQPTRLVRKVPRPEKRVYTAAKDPFHGKRRTRRAGTASKHCGNYEGLKAQADAGSHLIRGRTSTRLRPNFPAASVCARFLGYGTVDVAAGTDRRFVSICTSLRNRIRCKDFRSSPTIVCQSSAQCRRRQPGSRVRRRLSVVVRIKFKYFVTDPGCTVSRVSLSACGSPQQVHLLLRAPPSGRPVRAFVGVGQRRIVLLRVLHGPGCQGRARRADKLV